MTPEQKAIEIVMKFWPCEPRLDSEPKNMRELIEEAIVASIQSEREACAKLAEEGWRCNECKAVFLGDEGHACENPNWVNLTNNDIAGAIRARQ